MKLLALRAKTVERQVNPERPGDEITCPEGKNVGKASKPREAGG